MRKKRKEKKRKGLCLIGSSVVGSRGLDSSATASCSFSPLLLLVQLLRLQGIHPSISSSSFTPRLKRTWGGLNVLQKSSKEKKKDDLYYDLMHTMCVCQGGSLPTPHRIKVSANSLVLARVSLGATNDGIVQGCLAGLEGLFRRINHMK